MDGVARVRVISYKLYGKFKNVEWVVRVLMGSGAKWKIPLIFF